MMHSMEQITPVAAEIRKTQLIDLTRLNQLLEMKDLHRDAYAALSRIRTACKGCSTNTAPLDVVYTLARGFEGKPIGRLYEVKQLGMQAMWREIRAFIAEPNYWDVDVVNAHYSILLQLADGLGVEPFRTHHIRRYVEHRDEMLADISPSREVGKLLLIRILYGGRVDDMDTPQEDTECDHVDAEALEAIRNEVQDLTAVFWQRQPEMRTIQKIRKSSRGKVSFLSYYLHSLERKIVMCASDYLDSIGRRMDCIIHDGGLVRKMAGETEPPQQLLQDIRAYVKTHTGFDLQWTYKPLKHNFEVNVDIPEHEKYETVKETFEKSYFIYKGLLYHIGGQYTDTNGAIRYHRDNIYKMTQAQVIAANVYYKELKAGVIEKKPFFQKWIGDETRREYQHIDFIPKQEAPQGVYNTFRGFQLEETMKHKPEIMESAPKFETTRAYSWLREVICDNNEPRYMYLMALFYKMIFRPWEMSGVMPVLYSPEKGTGKSLLVSWLGKIVGPDMYASTSNPHHIFGAFNSLIEGRVICLFEESDLQMELTGSMKETITAESIVITRKGVDAYNQRNVCQFFQATNHSKAIMSESGCRRLFVVPVSGRYAGNMQYYSELYEELQRIEIQAAFYKYLQQNHANTYNMSWFQKNRPIEETLSTSQLRSESLMTKFFYHLSELSETNENGAYIFHREPTEAKTIYDVFLSEMEKTHKDYSVLSFSKNLSAKQYESFVEAHVRRDRKVYRIDYQGMREFLRRCGYIQ